jgi:hypothetical protein
MGDILEEYKYIGLLDRERYDKFKIKISSLLVSGKYAKPAYPKGNIWGTNVIRKFIMEYNLPYEIVRRRPRYTEQFSKRRRDYYWEILSK